MRTCRIAAFDRLTNRRMDVCHDERLALIDIAYGAVTSHVELHARITAQGALSQAVRSLQFAHPTTGAPVIAFYHWSRDCDRMEGDGVRLIPATIAAFERAENELHDNAEGPCRCDILTREEAAQFHPQWRDRAAEQMGY